MKLNVGCGRNILEGWVNIDSVALPGVNVVCDLNEPSAQRCHAPNMFDEFLLSHVIEHLKNPLVAMQTLWEWAKPGATMVIRCPHGASDDADEDPTHVRRMFPGSFGYFGQPYYWRADYGFRGDWRVDSIDLHPYPGLAMLPGTIANRMHTERNIIQEMVVTMYAVKPRREPLRALQVYVRPNIVM